MSTKTKVDDGGPAFGGAYDNVLFDTSGRLKPSTIEARSRGMSLLDYFAAQAMLGYLASPIMSREATDYPRRCAEWAYLQADAMLKARAGR